MMENCSSNIHKSLALNNAIKVMVINEKKDFLSSIGDLLKCHSFEVTCVDQVGVALRMLTEKQESFDLLLIDNEMRHVDTLTFLRLTRSMDLLSMVMCQEIDDNFVLKVFENGGFRVIKSPLTDDIVMQARQDVLRDRIHKSKLFKLLDGSETVEPESGSFQDGKLDGSSVKKKYFRWTVETHSIFLRAIHKLGEGKCFPRNIHEAMGVPGLTRVQVASHLQKYRVDASKILQGRGTPHLSGNKRSICNVSHEGYLTMAANIPSVATHVENHGQIVTEITSTFPSNIGQQNANNQSITNVTLPNDFGFGNLGQVNLVPTNLSESRFPPNQVSDDFFDIPNNNDEIENPSMACMKLNVSGPSSNNISDQFLLDHDQVMPSQGTSDFNQHI